MSLMYYCVFILLATHGVYFNVFHGFINLLINHYTIDASILYPGIILVTEVSGLFTTIHSLNVLYDLVMGFTSKTPLHPPPHLH